MKWIYIVGLTFLDNSFIYTKTIQDYDCKKKKLAVCVPLQEHSLGDQSHTTMLCFFELRLDFSKVLGCVDMV